MINQLIKIPFAVLIFLIAISYEAKADKIELTCEVFFVGDEGPDHIFEFFLDLDSKSNSFKYRGHSYEMDYTYTAPEMNVSKNSVTLTGFPDNNLLKSIEIFRYELSVFVEPKNAWGGIGSCSMGTKKPKF